MAKVAANVTVHTAARPSLARGTGCVANATTCNRRRAAYADRPTTATADRSPRSRWAKAATLRRPKTTTGTTRANDRPVLEPGVWSPTSRAAGPCGKKYLPSGEECCPCDPRRRPAVAGPRRARSDLSGPVRRFSRVSRVGRGVRFSAGPGRARAAPPALRWSRGPLVGRSGANAKARRTPEQGLCPAPPSAARRSLVHLLIKGSSAWVSGDNEPLINGCAIERAPRPSNDRPHRPRGCVR